MSTLLPVLYPWHWNQIRLLQDLHLRKKGKHPLHQTLSIFSTFGSYNHSQKNSTSSIWSLLVTYRKRGWCTELKRQLIVMYIKLPHEKQINTLEIFYPSAQKFRKFRELKISDTSKNVTFLLQNCGSNRCTWQDLHVYLARVSLLFGLGDNITSCQIYSRKTPTRNFPRDLQTLVTTWPVLWFSIAVLCNIVAILVCQL